MRPYDYHDITLKIKQSFRNYMWLEYSKSGNEKRYFKCQKMVVPSPNVEITIRLDNKCLYVKSWPESSLSNDTCNTLIESWENNEIYPETEHIGRRGFEILLDTGPAPSTGQFKDRGYDKCGDPEVEHKKLELNQVSKWRIYAKEIELEVIDWQFIEPPIGFGEAITGQKKDGTPPVASSENPPNRDPHELYDPHFTEGKAESPAYYYNKIIQSGGRLWCRNPYARDKPETPISFEQRSYVNVFQSQQYFCNYHGSSLRWPDKKPGSGFERFHQFEGFQCSYDFQEKGKQHPSCNKMNVYISETCDGWDQCEIGNGQSTITEIESGTGAYGYPWIKWKSVWDRQLDGWLYYSIDYNTHIDIIMWECNDSNDYRPLMGCEDCQSSVFEVIPDMKYALATEKLYRYTPEFQFCRPEVAMYEDRCVTSSNIGTVSCAEGMDCRTGDKYEFCPKGTGPKLMINKFSSVSTYMCRSRPNGYELDENGNPHWTQQGYMCTREE